MFALSFLTLAYTLPIFQKLQGQHIRDFEDMMLSKVREENGRMSLIKNINNENKAKEIAKTKKKKK